MNTKELIAALEAADPLGILEVVADNKPILFADWQPAYWDGPLIRYDTASNGRPKAATIVIDGYKVNLITRSLEETFIDFPKISVIINADLPDEVKRQYLEEAEKSREKTLKEIDEDG